MGREPLRPSLRRRVLVAVLALAGLAVVPPAAGAAAGPSLWTAHGTSAAGLSRHATAVKPQRFRAYALDRAGMLAALHTAPALRGRGAALTVSLPSPRGGFERFAVRLAPIAGPRTRAKYPDLLSLAGRGIDSRGATVRVDIGATGFHASVRGPQGAWYVDPYYQRDQSVYVSYFGRDVKPSAAQQTFVERELPHARRAAARRAAAVLGPTVTRRTYRLALLSDPSYASFFIDPGDAGTATSDTKVTAAKTALMDRVNQVYQEDLGIQMLPIDDPTGKLNFDTDAQMTGANGPCGGAPCFTADDPTTTDPGDGSAAFCGPQTLEDTGTTLGQVIGAANFDIGHLALGNDGGGIADLGVVGRSFKGWGCTGIPTPTGDFYAIDYVAHEMGHQFAGNHTFDGTQHNCGYGNRNRDTSVEPGSGSSIMAYAGICRQDNLQAHSDPYFSQRSFDEITDYTSTSRGAVDEVQNIGLPTTFDGTDSFVISYNGTTSSTVTRGTNYDNAGLAQAVAQATGLPLADITVDRFGHSGELDAVPGVPKPVTDAGFQVTFAGGTDIPFQLQIASPTGFTGFVSGETVHGGPSRNQGDATDSGNNRPVVTAPAPSFLPTRTPFSLTGSATDADGDPLTYMWEQNDTGQGTGTKLADNNRISGPLFRQFGIAAPVSDTDSLQFQSPNENLTDGNPTRVFPDMAQILAGTTNQATGTCPPAPPDETPTDGLDPATPLSPAARDCYSEFLPTAAWLGTGNRTMHFRLTARDGDPSAGGVGRADTTVTVVPTAGPFRVTAPGAGTALGRGATETVTWDVANTNLPPLNVANVKISLSSDGGQTFPDVLAASTPNDGSQAVTMPDSAGQHVRIKIEAIGNTFFDVSHGDAVLEYAPDLGSDAAGGRTLSYSDAIAPVTVTASDRDDDGAALAATASGLPSGLTLTQGPASAAGTRPGTRTFTVSGNPTASPGSYPVTVTVHDGSGSSRSVSFPVVVTPENATARYTGDRAAERRQGTATLAADVAEIADGAPGDIGTATVTFSQRGTVLCGPIPVTRRADGTGTASCETSLGGGTHPVDVNVGGNYTAATNTTLAGANPVLCDSSVVLTGLSRKGSRVRISGFAERRFAGLKARVTANGRVVARPRVKSDGSFTARVKAPKGRHPELTRYRAQVAGQRSPALRLGRQLTLTSITRTTEGTRVRGRLAGRNHARRKLSVVRAVDCASRRKVTTLRTDGRGRFSVTLPRPRKGTTAVYRVRTAGGTPRSLSLPVVISRK